MLKTRDIPNVEILSEGTWHGTGCPPAGCEFTGADLDAIVDTYEATKDVLTPPLKLGHDDNQKLLQADGYPAAGWLTNIRRDGKKLLADLLKVPAKIADLIDVGAYLKRSVELEGDYEIGGKKYPLALTGMALLGADLPAVENLDDIIAWYSKQRLSLASNARAVIFSVTPELNFALPAGMSYDDLTQRLRAAFIESNPGADEEVWVSDLFEDTAIFCLAGRYWQQAYTVTRAGAVSISGTPTEVARVSQWRSVAAGRPSMSYADNAEHVLADVQAFLERTTELVRLRATDGRVLSDQHRERLARVGDGLTKACASLGEISGEPPPDPEPDYTKVMQVRSRLANIRMAELAGATT